MVFFLIINGCDQADFFAKLMTLIKNGVSCIELDFMYTTDGSLVCNHGWEDFRGRAQSYRSFRKHKTPGGFTPMTAKKALKMLIRSGRTCLVLDTQEKNVAGVYRDIVNICRENGGEDYLKMIVPQIYQKKEYAKIRRIWRFENWIFTVYKMSLPDNAAYNDLADFCAERGIQVITMPKGRVTKVRSTIIHGKGLYVATHTVNSKKELQILKKSGADIFYTDYLY